MILRAIAPAATRAAVLPRRGAPAAAVVAQAVFGVVGVVGVAGAVEVADVRVILRALIDILDHERDRRAGRDLFPARVVDHDAREDLHLVGFAALGGEARLAGPAAIEIALDVGRRQRQPRRSAVDHAADRCTMALAEGGHPKQMAEAVVGHEIAPARLVARARDRVK